MENASTDQGKPTNQTAQTQIAEKCDGAAVARAMAWRSLVSKCGERYRDCKLKNFELTTPGHAEAVEALKAFCVGMRVNWENGTGLILFGPKGTGKDHLAMACARVAVACDLRVEWVNGLDLFAEFRDAIGAGVSEQSIVERFSKPDILYVSDPLPPSGALTEFQAGVLFRILDRRYRRKRPTWVTVNVIKASEMDERMGPQNGDRIRDGAVAVFCDWPTHRKVKA